jgi:hypothetical protein
VLRANYRRRGLVLAAAGGLFGLVALAVAVFGIPGILPREATVVLAAALTIAILMGGAGALVLLRGEPVILVLRPEGLSAPGLDRTIAWSDIADLDLTGNHGGLVMRVLLPPAVPWPERRPGRPAAKLDPKRRIVTLPLPMPRGMNPQGFADLIATYQLAAQARSILSGTAAAAPVTEPA